MKRVRCKVNFASLIKVDQVILLRLFVTLKGRNDSCETKLVSTLREMVGMLHV